MSIDRLRETKLYKVAICVLPPIILLLYPLIGVNQGVDLADTGYNIATYRYMFEWDGYWTLAMLLANVSGYLITCLPGGGTLLGLNVYTCLILGMGGMFTYLALSRKLPRIVVFVGELIALGLCWCPSSIFYNYLSYLLILVALWMLFKGLTEKKVIWLFAAGIILGINVFVRFSNLTQMAFVVGVWFYVLVEEKWKTKGNWLVTILRPTLWCIGGYIVGMGVVLGGIAATCGITNYSTTILRLASMSGSSEGYTLTSMLIDAWKDYLAACPLLFLLIFCTVAGMVLFKIGGEHRARVVKICIYLLGLLVLVRLLWGRRILDTDYYSIGAIWYLANLFAVIAYLLNVWCLIYEKKDHELQLLALFSLLTLLIAPLGTNNHAYATINNLFLVAPMTVFFMYRYFIQNKNFAIQAMAVFVLMCLMVQTIGFHITYVFGDSSSYEKRDTKIVEDGILKGIVTSRRKALNLESLEQYIETQQLQDKTLYLYGNIPALCYYLDQRPATPMMWPDVESYEPKACERDLQNLKGLTSGERPLVIINIAQAALVDESVVYLGETPSIKDAARQKLEMIYAFLEEEQYEKTFQNELFVVYE